MQSAHRRARKAFRNETPISRVENELMTSDFTDPDDLIMSIA